MSVAFRRESDDEHKEPKFERPIPPGPNLVTARGLAALEQEVAATEAAVEAAPDDTAREALRRDLRYWRTRLATARIAPRPEPDVIGIGSRAHVRLDGAERWIEIVGGDEAAPDAGRIAFSAPLARVLIGAGAGDRLDFGGKADALEVLAVELPPA